MNAVVLLPFVVAFGLGITLLAMPGCAPAEPEAANVCEAADQHLSACGVMLPVTRGGACVGARKMLAQCMVDHADGCDELASLLRRVDSCIADATDAGDIGPGRYSSAMMLPAPGGYHYSIHPDMVGTLVDR
jgi:hypothetical protein